MLARLEESTLFKHFKYSDYLLIGTRVFIRMNTVYNERNLKWLTHGVVS